MTIQTVRDVSMLIFYSSVSVDNARKLKFCSYDHLQSINKKFSRPSTFEDGRHISGLEQRKLILSSYFLLNTFHMVTLG